LLWDAIIVYLDSIIETARGDVLIIENDLQELERYQLHEGFLAKTDASKTNAATAVPSGYLVD
jgi:hypothetical protein